MRVWLGIAGGCAIGVLGGCHSRYVETTITNATGAKVSVVQVEYPSASFGVQTLDAGQVFHYRFKVYGSKPVTLAYFDAGTKEHHQTGPVLSEGDEGTLDITLQTPDHAEFQARLHR